MGAHDRHNMHLVLDKISDEPGEAYVILESGDKIVLDVSKIVITSIQAN